MARCDQLPTGGFRSRRHWLLAVQLLAAAVILTMLVLSVVRISNKASGSDACRRRRQLLPVLPPEPSSDHQMIANLADHLVQPSSKPCQRELVLGGEPHEYSKDSVGVVGMKSACLDPGLSLARSDCLVVASRPAIDASFDAAAVLFGCEVHSYGPDVGRRLDPALTELPGGRRPVSLLALDLDARQLADMLLRPPAALRRVEQLTVRLNLTQALAAGGDAPLLRRLYGGLLRLQRAGFHPFVSIVVEDESVVDITLEGQKEAFSTVSEVGWMKVFCDG